MAEASSYRIRQNSPKNCCHLITNITTWQVSSDNWICVSFLDFNQMFNSNFFILYTDGFHKITSIDNGGLKFDKDEMEFSHPYFQKGHPYLLEHIKRKIANPKQPEEKGTPKVEAMNRVLSEVKNMRGRQDSLDSRFSAMKQENEALWREVAILRQKHMKQQQIVNKVRHFPWIFYSQNFAEIFLSFFFNFQIFLSFRNFPDFFFKLSRNLPKIILTFFCEISRNFFKLKILLDLLDFDFFRFLSFQIF